MVVAMLAVLMMQMGRDEKIEVIGVWDPLMAARCAVTMFFNMTFTCMRAAARRRLVFRRGEHVLIDVIAVRAVKMAVMEIVDVIIMTNLSMAATVAVVVVVVGMSLVFHYD